MVTPRGEKMYEIVVVGDDEVGSFEKVIKVMSDRYVNLRDVSAYDSPGTGSFVMHVFADFSKAEGDPEDLKKAMAKLPFVKTVAMGGLSGFPYSRYLFPVFITGTPRVVILPAAILMDCEAKSLETFGELGKASMYEIGRTAGIRLSDDLRAFLPWSNPRDLLEGAADQLRALGWGIFKFDMSEMKSGHVVVSIYKPAFLGIPGKVDSWILKGIGSGITESVLTFPNELDGKARYSSEKEEFQFALKPRAANASPGGRKAVRASKSSRK